MAVTLNIPSQVRTFANLAAFPASGSLKTIYIAEDTNKTYRWTGSVYVEISASAATGLTVGTTPIASGTVGRVLFDGTGNVLQESANLFWDNTNARLGIGTSSPLNTLDIVGTNRLTGTASIVPIFALNAVGANSNSAYIDLRVSNTSKFQMGYTQASGQNRFFIYNNALAAPNDIVRIYETTNNIGINTATDGGFRLDVNGTARVQGLTTLSGTMTASGAIARNQLINGTLVAAANGDALVGLDVNSTFTNGAFTGVENIPIRNVITSNAAVTKNILLKNIGAGVGTGVSIGFNTNNANNLSHAFIKSFYVTSGLSMSFGTGGGTALNAEGTTALILNDNQTANFTAKVTANSGGFQANGVSANLLMSDNGTPVITRNGSTGIEFLKDSFWQTFSIFTNNSERMRVASTGNVLINTTTDAGFRLDVNGTARVSAKLTVNNDIISSRDGNLVGRVDVSNTTSGASSLATFVATSSAGSLWLGKYSATTTANKITLPNDSFISNLTVGDLAISNDVATGRIKFAAGGSSTSHMIIKANGVINMAAIPTSATGLSSGDIWNDGGTLKIV
jgi:hypothetical protein